MHLDSWASTAKSAWVRVWYASAVSVRVRYLWIGSNVSPGSWMLTSSASAYRAGWVRASAPLSLSSLQCSLAAAKE